MAKMKDLRAQLVADLAAVGVPVMDDWAIRAEAPCIYLIPPLGNSYVVGGPQFATYVMNLDILVLVESQAGSGEDRDLLEDITEDVLRNTVDWALTGVDSPGTASVADSTIVFLGTIVHLAKQFTL